MKFYLIYTTHIQIYRASNFFPKLLIILLYCQVPPILPNCSTATTTYLDVCKLRDLFLKLISRQII